MSSNDKDKTIVVRQVNARGVQRLTRNDGYRVPKGGTTQARMTDEEIADKLKDYVEVKSKDLCNIKLSTWIRYIQKRTKLYRAGGVLQSVGPDYIVLVNPYNKKSWSVQIKDNKFYTKDEEKIARQKAKEERIIKAYNKGLLVKKKTKKKSSSSSSSSSRRKK